MFIHLSKEAELMTDVSQAFEELKRGSDEILVEDELLAKLKSLKIGDQF